MGYYLDEVDTDTDDECEFAHQLLVAWAAWIYGADTLGPTRVNGDHDVSYAME